MARPRIGSLVVLFALLSIGSTTQAQTFRGGIRGTVFDPTGAVIAEVAVKAESDSTGLTYSTTSSSAGEFSLQDLPLGTYTVLTHKDGFRDVIVSRIPLEAGVVYSLPVHLEVATSQNRVDVSSNALAIETSTVTQSNVLDDSTVEGIPLNGRDFTQPFALSSGYSGYTVGFLGAINGTQGDQINWQIEGADNNDLWNNTSAVNQGGVYGVPGVLLPLDSVQEFSLVTQGSAEAGRNPGGVANVSLKSGTNQIHGTAYYFNRNEALAVISPFATTGSERQEIRNQQYGGSVGGPIRKNSTFYYAAFERQSFLIGLPEHVTEPSLGYQAAAENVLNNPGGIYGNYAPIAVNPVFSHVVTEPVAG